MLLNSSDGCLITFAVNRLSPLHQLPYTVSPKHNVKRIAAFLHVFRIRCTYIVENQFASFIGTVTRRLACTRRKCIRFADALPKRSNLVHRLCLCRLCFFDSNYSTIACTIVAGRFANVAASLVVGNPIG